MFVGNGNPISPFSRSRGRRWPEGPDEGRRNFHGPHPNPLPQERERGSRARRVVRSLVTFCLFVQEAMLQSREIAMALPLAGMRVLDVSQVMAGPFCCMLLRDLCADVLKVEHPRGGHPSRGSMGVKLRGT